jgi:adenosine deaminase
MSRRNSGVAFDAVGDESLNGNNGKSGFTHCSHHGSGVVVIVSALVVLVVALAGLNVLQYVHNGSSSSSSSSSSRVAPALTTSAALFEFLNGMPKTALHVHLEGTLEAELAFKLAQKHKMLPLRVPRIGGGDTIVNTLAELRKVYKFDDLQSFLNVCTFCCDVCVSACVVCYVLLAFGCVAVRFVCLQAHRTFPHSHSLISDNALAVTLKDKADFESLAAAYAEKAASQTVRYAELFFDPQTHTARGIAFRDVADGLNAGLATNSPAASSAPFCATTRSATRVMVLMLMMIVPMQTTRYCLIMRWLSARLTAIPLRGIRCVSASRTTATSPGRFNPARSLLSITTCLAFATKHSLYFPLLCSLPYLTLPFLTLPDLIRRGLPASYRIIALGTDNEEMGNPPSLFTDVYAYAFKNGLLGVAHAGEEGPPAYVWEAINDLHVARIDHGVRSGR